MKQFLFLLFIGATLSFSACKGKDGLTGPAGTAGTNGTNGTNGNANVKSVLIDVAKAEWVVSTADNLIYSTKPCAIITQDIADKGLVMVYAKGNFEIFNVGDDWVALPFTYAKSSSGTPTWTESWWHHYSQGTITFNGQDNDQLYSNPNLTFKVVAISSTGRLAPINFNNYTEVAEYFDLKE
jgi:hypothetical protein